MIPTLLRNEPLAPALALWRAPGLGPRTFQLLKDRFADLSDVFSKSLEAIAKLRPETLVYLQAPDWAAVERDLTWATDPLHNILTHEDPHYPPQLKEISFAPPLLFVDGDVCTLRQRQLAIVGSRNPSAVGEENAFAFALDLSLHGWVITSGLALGVDYYAHRGALHAKGSTIAVMATGLDEIYPYSHRELAAEIRTQGACVSEFPLGTGPQGKHFPRRNRIISGLSSGVLVVEAALKSGSLITARYAVEQGREVFAIPGSIHHPLAKGCHQLIRQGAKLIETSQCLMEEFAWISMGAKKNSNP